MSGVKKQLNIKILVSALLISTLLFSAGFFTGYSINKEKLSSLEYEITNINKDVENFQLQFLLFDILGEKAACPLLEATLSDINKKSYEIGSRLESMESDSEILSHDEYVSMKKEYSRILIGYWLLANKFKKTCESNVSTILYFFAKKCDRCGDQSFVLTYLKRKFGEKLLIFALDADLDEPSIQTLKTYYKITVYPSLVVNEKLHEGFYSTEKLEKELKIQFSA
jgi:hypothetical protein